MANTRKRKELEVTIETITPKIAREWLESNTHNRKMKRGVIASIKRDIKAGNWKMNGATIVFAKDGTLLDGQNRLYAIIAANRAVRSIVVRNAERTAQITMDAGAKRSLADVLTLKGVSSATSVAAILSMIFKKKNGNSRERLVKGGGGDQQPTHHEGLALYEDEGQQIHEALLKVGSSYRKVGVSQSVLGFLYWEFSQIEKADADYFFDKLGSGEMLEPTSPILVARNFLITNANKPGHLRHSPTVLLAIITKAWNFFRRRDEIKRIYVRAIDKLPDPI